MKSITLFSFPDTDADITIDAAGTDFQFEVETVEVPGVGSFKKIQVTQGDTVTLTCRINTYTSGDSVTWTNENAAVSYNGLLLAPNENVR